MSSFSTDRIRSDGSLVLNFQRLQEEEITQIAKILESKSTLPIIKSLNLLSCGIQTTGVVLLAKAIATNSVRLTSLNLSQNRHLKKPLN